MKTAQSRDFDVVRLRSIQDRAASLITGSMTGPKQCFTVVRTWAEVNVVTDDSCRRRIESVAVKRHATYFLD